MLLDQNRLVFFDSSTNRGNAFFLVSSPEIAWCDMPHEAHLFETRESAWIVRSPETRNSLEYDRGDTNSFELSLVA
jgi:hypothetical protein